MIFSSFGLKTKLKCKTQDHLDQDLKKNGLKTFITDVNGYKLYKYSGLLVWMSVFIKLGKTVSIVQVAKAFSLFFRTKIL